MVITYRENGSLLGNYYLIAGNVNDECLVGDKVIDRLNLGCPGFSGHFKIPCWQGSPANRVVRVILGLLAVSSVLVSRCRLMQDCRLHDRLVVLVEFEAGGIQPTDIEIDESPDFFANGEVRVSFEEEFLGPGVEDQPERDRLGEVLNFWLAQENHPATARENVVKVALAKDCGGECELQELCFHIYIKETRLTRQNPPFAPGTCGALVVVVRWKTSVVGARAQSMSVS